MELKEWIRPIGCAALTLFYFWLFDGSQPIDAIIIYLLVLIASYKILKEKN